MKQKRKKGRGSDTELHISPECCIFLSFSLSLSLSAHPLPPPSVNNCDILFLLSYKTCGSTQGDSYPFDASNPPFISPRKKQIPGLSGSEVSAPTWLARPCLLRTAHDFPRFRRPEVFQKGGVPLQSRCVISPWPSRRWRHCFCTIHTAAILFFRRPFCYTLPTFISRSLDRRGHGWDGGS